jgi:hypothetical protein
VNGVPLAIEVPPHEPAYQTQEAPVPREPPTIINVEDTPGQTAAAELDIDEGSVDNVLRLTVVLTQAEV